MGLTAQDIKNLYKIDCVSTHKQCTSPPWFRISGMCPIINDSTTNDQLIMRRKAEGLQHKNNSANLTKKQKWSQMVRTNVKLGAKLPNPGKYWTITKLPGGTWSESAKNARMEGQFLVAELKKTNKTWVESRIKVLSPNHRFQNKNGEFHAQSGYTQPTTPEGTFIPPYCKYPSSASDVPGKIIDLYLDKRIQPWGVGPQRRSFAMGGLWTKLYAGPGYPRK